MLRLCYVCVNSIWHRWQDRRFNHHLIPEEGGKKIQTRTWLPMHRQDTLFYYVFQNFLFFFISMIWLSSFFEAHVCKCALGIWSVWSVQNSPDNVLWARNVLPQSNRNSDRIPSCWVWPQCVPIPTHSSVCHTLLFRLSACVWVYGHYVLFQLWILICGNAGS